MGIKRYLQKFLDAFSVALGYATGFFLPLVMLAIIIARVLENIKIEESTATSFALILSSLALVLFLSKTSR